ncbi:hypothetical protein B7767_37415 [Streptomyces sp. 13-12-16]|nr:hypothetical protein B7767_37415 [Streptomyces sp. 13-12-16]
MTGAAGLPASATAEARRVPGVLAATGVRRTSVVVPGGLEARTVTAQGIDPEGVERTMDLKVRSGSLTELREGTVAVSTAQADAAGWHLGDEAGLWLGDGTPVTLRVVALYERGWGFGDVTLHTETLAGHTVTGLDDRVLIRTAPDADTGAGLAGLAGRYPAAALVDTDRLTGDIAQDLAVSGWLNKLLIAVLVGYAVLAAANTLVMAALARTRELALLRLAGVTRRQVKRMVHAEQAGLLGTALVIGGAIAAVTLTSVVNAVAGQRVPYVPAAGWAVVVGGTVILALVATVLPVGRLLRTPPVEGIGLRE